MSLPLCSPNIRLTQRFNDSLRGGSAGSKVTHHLHFRIFFLISCIRDSSHGCSRALPHGYWIYSLVHQTNASNLLKFSLVRLYTEYKQLRHSCHLPLCLWVPFTVPYIVPYILKAFLCSEAMMQRDTSAKDTTSRFRLFCVLWLSQPKEGHAALKTKYLRAVCQKQGEWLFTGQRSVFLFCSDFQWSSSEIDMKLLHNPADCRYFSVPLKALFYAALRCITVWRKWTERK